MRGTAPLSRSITGIRFVVERGKVDVYIDGNEEAAERQDLQVPGKARKSWNELRRAMTW